ncbi:MAG: RNA polymerase sigma factor [Planctomycetota bacterium]
MSENPNSTEFALLNHDEVTQELYAQWSVPGKKYAMSIVKSWSDAEEIVQESFLRLVRQDDVAKINKSMLFAVIRNLSIDYWRQSRSQNFESLQSGEIAATGQDSGNQLEALESGIEAAMKKLPENWTEALQLKINGGLSYSEIADVLQATKNQVRTWIFRGRKQLEKELRDKGLLTDNLRPSGGIHD